MPAPDIVIRFHPQGRAVSTPPGALLLEAAAGAGVTLNTPCGGQGTCGKCRVRIMEGAPPTDAAGSDALSAAERSDGWRLACRSVVTNNMVVEVPEASLLPVFHRILMATGEHADGDAERPCRKIHARLPAPALDDDRPDTTRLAEAAGPFSASLEVLRELPARLRASDFAGTAVLAGERLIAWEPGDTRGANYAAAFDIGTTTLGAVLLDLHGGGEAARASRMNPQMSWGADVLTRIRHAQEGPEALEALRRAIIKAVSGLLETLCADADVQPEHIYGAVFAGNTAMQHLLLGIDPTALGRVPFVPALGAGAGVGAAEAGVKIHPRGRVHVFPVIGGFVGGDTVAGLLATGLDGDAGPVLFIDIGTNGEIVAAHDGKLLAASCAAGPAFEGARISQGMRAAPGAIEKVWTEDGDVRLYVIGGGAPAGLCGSGLIDAAAELLRLGVLAPQGLIVDAEDVPVSVPEAIRRRIVPGEAGNAFVLWEARNGETVAVTQRDIRELQLATAAIRAGIGVLLKRAGLAPKDLDRILVAGGFGNYIRRGNAQQIGLLPMAVPGERIVFAGNTALSGACLAAASLPAREKAEALARQAVHVELSQDPAFHNAFIEGMFFPENAAAAEQA